MVSSSRGSYKFGTIKSLSKKSSPSTLTLYILLLFGLSMLIFLLYARDVLKDDQNSVLVNGFQSPPHPQHHPQRVVDEKLWVSPFSHGLRPCVEPTAKYKAPRDSGKYIIVRSNGGLNQMRIGIADMVAVARIMNATLVIPQLDKRSFWQDSSAFVDIFDEVHFIQSLQQDVRIVKELPKHLEPLTRARKHFTSWSGMSYYENMTHLWNIYQD